MSISFFYCEFDPIDGPAIVQQVCGQQFTDEELCSIKLTSFPESYMKIKQTPHIYTFRAGSKFCYTYYHSIPDKTKQRGYHQFSYVIATDNTYYPIWYRLLKSVDTLKFTPRQSFDLLVDFGKKIYNNFEADKQFELPLFNGPTTIVNCPKIDELILSHSSSTDNFTSYLSNGFFIGDNLETSIGISSLIKNGHGMDIVRLWENVILEKPILVVGATPEIASRAVFAIASLSFSSAIVPNVVPYILVTDPNFSNICSTKSIIGVSNPIAVPLSRLTPFYVGFDDKFGFDDTKCSKIKNMTSQEIRAMCAASNDSLIRIMNKITSDLYSSNPIFTLLGKIDLTIIESHIKTSGITIYSPVESFCREFVKTSLFKQFLQEESESEDSVEKVMKFEYTNMSCDDLHTLSAQIGTIIRKKHHTDSMRKALKHQLKKSYSSFKLSQVAV